MPGRGLSLALALIAIGVGRFIGRAGADIGPNRESAGGRSGTLQGFLVLPTGEPALGFGLGVRGKNENGETKNTVRREAVLVGADGAFSFEGLPSGVYELESDEACRLEPGEAHTGEDPVTVTVANAHSLELAVREDDRPALADTVVFRLNGRSGRFPIHVVTSPGAEGRYHFHSCENGEVTAVVSRGGRRASTTVLLEEGRVLHEAVVHFRSEGRGALQVLVRPGKWGSMGYALELECESAGHSSRTLGRCAEARRVEDLPVGSYTGRWLPALDDGRELTRLFIEDFRILVERDRLSEVVIEPREGAVVALLVALGPGTPVLDLEARLAATGEASRLLRATTVDEAGVTLHPRFEANRAVLLSASGRPIEPGAYTLEITSAARLVEPRSHPLSLAAGTNTVRVGCARRP